MTDLAALLRKWYETATKKQKLTAALLIFSLAATGLLVSLTGGSSTAGDPLSSAPFYYVGAFFKLGVVLLLIIGISVVFRRWLQPGLGGKSARQMRLLETVRLSPKQALHLVMIGDQRIVIGATDHAVSVLISLDGEPDPVVDGTSQPQADPDFGSMLRLFDFSLPPKERGEA